jgi:hypothetical protein
MTAIGESCRRRGHHLPAVYDPKRKPAQRLKWRREAFHLYNSKYAKPEQMTNLSVSYSY